VSFLLLCGVVCLSRYMLSVAIAAIWRHSFVQIYAVSCLCSCIVLVFYAAIWGQLAVQLYSISCFCKYVVNHITVPLHPPPLHNSKHLRWLYPLDSEGNNFKLHTRNCLG
jgi:hypothetical protein